MPGLLADFFRFWWGLLYWNTRKSWFRLRGGRSTVPCQSLSDSGRARETQCEACVTWAKPRRFRRLCPLLVETPQGLRCGADTADVRPFWGVAGLWFGGTALALYLAGAVAIFAFLRTVGYPVSIVHVVLPPLWHKVGQARGWFFLERSNRAFAEGKTAEGLLYLANSYDFDPSNYAAGLALAKNFQAGKPGRSDEVFARLLRDHPDKRAATAQDWFRALLSRGNFEQIAALAHDELLADATHGGVWLRALIFAVRHGASEAPLRRLLAAPAAHLQPWRPVLETELLLRARRSAKARAAIERPWPAATPPFGLFYRVSTLIELGDPIAAMDLLERSPGVLDAEAATTLRLDGYAASGARSLLQRHFDLVLSGRLDPPRVKILATHLIRRPDAALFTQLWIKAQRDVLPLNNETAGAWFSLFCAAGAVGDRDRLHELTVKLRTASPTPFVALSLVEAFFRGETAERRISAYLPILPLPLEVSYALLDRYSPGPALAPPVTVPIPAEPKRP